MPLTPFPIGLRRLARQGIAHPAFHDAGEVAAWLGALQGQDYLGTKWAFGLRLPNSTEATIVSAGRIIGTWKQALKKKAVEITLQPFRPLRPDEHDSLAEATARYGRFLGLAPLLT
jgi:hypothetical protein